MRERENLNVCIETERKWEGKWRNVNKKANLSKWWMDVLFLFLNFFLWLGLSNQRFGSVLNSGISAFSCLGSWFDWEKSKSGRRKSQSGVPWCTSDPNTLLACWHQKWSLLEERGWGRRTAVCLRPVWAGVRTCLETQTRWAETSDPLDARHHTVPTVATGGLIQWQFLKRVISQPWKMNLLECSYFLCN